MRSVAVWVVLYYLRFFSRLALTLHKPYIIGIAGSAGKSSARNALFAIFSKQFSTKMIGNSETGIPLGILGIVPETFTPSSWLVFILRAPFGLYYLRNTKYLIIEMGIDDPFPPKNMEYLLSIVKPNIAIELNVSVGNTVPNHIMQFEKLLKNQQALDKHEYILQKLAEEDTKIISNSNCDVGIYNIDDLYVQKCMVEFERTKPLAKLLTFGESRENDISYLSYSVSLDGCSFAFSVKEGSKQRKISLNFTKMLLPREYREVFASSILTALEIGIDHDKIISSLEENYSLPSGRASVFDGINNSIIIDSSYNAARASMIAFLDMVKLLKKQTKQPVVVIFGDMRELGDESEKEHIEVAKYMQDIVDYVYLVGSQTKEFVFPFFEHNRKIGEVKWFDNSREAGLFLKNNLPSNAIVLAKGSQNTIFLEEAIKFILANKEDEKKLCRQDPHFLHVKLRQYGS